MLDESGERTAAAYLQHALDILLEEPKDDTAEYRLVSVRARGVISGVD
jgi:hypothetical protein